MPAKTHTRLRNHSVLGVLVLTVIIATLYGLHLWLPHKLAQHAQDILEAHLKSMGVHNVTANEWHLNSRHLTLNDVTLKWQEPNMQSLELHHVMIHWAPKWQAPERWITGLSLSEARLNINRNHKLNPLETLHGWQTILLGLNDLPWPLEIDSGVIQQRGQTDSTTPENEQHFTKIGGFTLKENRDANALNLLVWLNHPQAHVFNLRFNRSAPLLKNPLTNRPWSFTSTTAITPFDFTWQFQGSRLALQYWPPATAQLQQKKAAGNLIRSIPTPTHQQDALKQDFWHIRGSGHLRYQDFKMLGLSNTIPDLGNAEIKLETFNFTLPEDFSTTQSSAWFEQVTGELDWRLENLAWTLPPRPLPGNLSMNGSGVLDAQPGHWTLTLHAPADFIGNFQSHTLEPVTQIVDSPDHQMSALDTLISSLFPPETPMRLVGTLPARTQLTITGANLFQLRAEDRSNFSLNSRAYTIRGHASQLTYEKSENSQFSAMLEMDWEAPPAAPISLLTQIDLQKMAQLMQLDINGASLSAGLQWDLHTSIDAPRRTLFMDRLLVMNPFNRQSRVNVEAFGTLFPTFNAIAAKQQQSFSEAPPFGHLSIKTNAAIPLIHGDSHSTGKNNHALLSSLQLTPLNALIEPSLFLLKPNDAFLRNNTLAKWQDSLHFMRIHTHLDDLELSWLLQTLNITGCRAKGKGALSFEFTPSESSTGQLDSTRGNPHVYYQQNTAGFLSCDGSTNLSAQLQSLQPHTSGQYFLPFKALTLTYSNTHDDDSTHSTAVPPTAQISLQQPTKTLTLTAPLTLTP